MKISCWGDKAYQSISKPCFEAHHDIREMIREMIRVRTLGASSLYGRLMNPFSPSTFQDRPLEDGRDGCVIAEKRVMDYSP